MAKTKLTYELIETMAKLKRNGLNNKDICAAVGITETTFYRWIGKPTSKLHRALCESLKKAEAERKEELLRQYPDMVSKLSLLLGAGMTLNGAWERIVKNYQLQLAQKRSGQAEVYEQMLIAYREIQDGMGELKAYERFGARCATPQYRKLSTLIVQNLRKGSASLSKLLEKEVTDAFTVRKNHAKKAGEEAGTKLLLPMMLMLCIVLVIILVPAILSFQM